MVLNTLYRTVFHIIYLVAGHGNRWRTITLLFLVLNYKNLPFAWHLRFFNGALRHSLRPKAAPRLTSSDAYPLFLPIITSTRAPIAECDYNIHKSNSTYFSDLDISRTHLISLLCSPGISDYQRRRRSGEAKGGLLIGLGGVACFFLKEIKPYEGYELWTRVLCWDNKWVYTVTHFVKKGAVKPEHYLLNSGMSSWFSKDAKSRQARQSMVQEENVNGAAKKDIFAFAISKYVFKYGRKTIAPEAVFERCGQLPTRPKDLPPPKSSSFTEDSAITERLMKSFTEDSKNDQRIAEESLEPVMGGQETWSWDMVEKERQRGMHLAEHMLAMDKLKEEFTGNSKPALGVYRDLLWS